MGEGPVKVRNRRRRVRQYAAIAAATIMERRRRRRCHDDQRERVASYGRLGSPPSSRLSEQLVLPERHRHADQARGRDLPGEHLLRPLLGTYPYAANTDGNTFDAKQGTPTVNGLYAQVTPSGPTGRCSPIIRTSTIRSG